MRNPAFQLLLIILLVGITPPTVGSIRQCRDNLRKTGKEMGRTDLRDKFYSAVAQEEGGWIVERAVSLPDGYRIRSGERVVAISTMARGGGIRDIHRLLRTYGGRFRRWKKQSGLARVTYRGRTNIAEVHWYYEPTAGRVELKFKRWLCEGGGRRSPSSTFSPTGALVGRGGRSSDLGCLVRFPDQHKSKGMESELKR